MKLLFAGTPQFAVAPLVALIEAFDVVGVVTQEDKPQGRKRILTPSPVKICAAEHSLPVFQPKSLRDEADTLASFGADVLVTCAYGQILTQEIIDLFPLGVWNIHAGLLPFYRGASPVQSCILNGESESGVCVMRTVAALDAGDVLTCDKLSIGKDETAGELSNRLSALSARSIVRAMASLQSGDYVLTPQDESKARIYRKITREQAKIDFSSSAAEISCKVRAMNPEPIAHALHRGAPVNIHRVAIVPEAELSDEQKNAKIGEVLTDKPKQGLLIRCGNGAIKVLSLQPCGGKAMSAADYLNGGKAKKGELFE